MQIMLPILLFLGLTCGGCVALPVPHPSFRYENSRKVIDEADYSFIAIGHTPREELILKLGEPDWVLKRERVLVWKWITCEWTVLWLAGGGMAPGAVAGGSIDVENCHYLLVGFDERGIAARYERRDDKPFQRIPVRSIVEY